MGLVGLGDQHHPGRVLVQPVDDAGPEGVLPVAEPRGVERQGVDDRPGLLGMRGVADDPRLLAERDDLFVFVQNLERDVLRDHLRRLGVRQHHLDDVTAVHFIAGLGRAPVDGDGSLPNQTLDRCPREVRVAAV